MKLILLLFLSLTIFKTVNAESFDDLVRMVDNHSKLESIQDRNLAIENEGKAKSKWDEPQLQLDATNLPSNNPSLGYSPMSSYGITLSQKVPLTSKYSNISKSYESLSSAEKYRLDILKREIILGIWKHAIIKERLLDSFDIYKENLNWIDGMIKVSNKLYTTGKVSQQVILDLKIRKSQIISDIETTRILLNKINVNLAKSLDLPGKNIDLDLTSINWAKLDNFTDNGVKTPQESFLEEQTNAARYKQKADSQDRLPEINVGLSYRYRDNIDKNGDFIGVFVSVPIGNGRRKYNAESSVYNYRKARNDLKSYQNELKSLKQELKLEIQRLETELNILQSQTIKSAITSKEVVSKRYAVGKSDYLELLRSELQLQNLLLQEVNLKAQIKENKAIYLFEVGLNMY